MERMKISPTDRAPAPVVGGETLLGWAGRGGWLLLDAGGVIVRGAADEVLAASPGTRTVLAVPGTMVAIHWLELAEGLAPAQAAAAARLMLADASAEPLDAMHVAVGRVEAGLTPVALVPNASMAAWVAGDPDLIVPEPLLIAPPAEGFACRAREDGPGDYRGQGAAFSAEPELAALLVGEAPIAALSEDAFEAGLPAALAAPVLNLRQGPFARRRVWLIDRARLRRIAAMVVALAVLSLAVQLLAIWRYTAEADRMEAEIAALGTPAGVEARPAFGALAAILFESVRATPNAELGRIDYRADGSLGATLLVDSPATLAAFRQRIEASGVGIEGGALTNAGGRPSAELVLRPS
jgi:general secretion pathway protein L